MLSKPVSAHTGRTASGLATGTLRTGAKYLASVGLLVGLTSGLDFGSRELPVASRPTATIPPATTPLADLGLIDPRSQARAFADARGLVPVLSSGWSAVVPAAAAPVEPVPARPVPLAATVAALVIPLPVPRPADLAGIVRPQRPTADRRQAAPIAPSDERSFFEKLFGGPAKPDATVTLASLDTRPVTVAPTARTSPSVSSGSGVAIYDISARSVTLPNGERLEAHSGLGDRLDDPKSVNIRMRGATPPGEYDLTEREQLFHGVRALRLTPVGGAGAVFGRAGLLAHTFMLGPNGDSNGCVSFRDYERFLQAYLKGEIRRLVVVTGHGAVPGLLDRRFGMPEQPASRNRDT